MRRPSAAQHLPVEQCRNGHEGGVNGTASIALVSEDGIDAVVVALNLRDGTDPRMSALADDLLCPALQSSK